MAMIKCPNCGKEISDKAKKCIGCGMIFDEEIESSVIVCTECGAEISENTELCPNCGCPTEIQKNDSETEAQKVEITSVNMPEMGKKTKKTAIVVAALVIVIAIVGFVVKNFVSTNYLSDLKSTTTLMISGAAEAEDAGNLIKSVWYNTIYEKSDANTNKYTKSDYGWGFNSDFNVSLQKLFADVDFQAKISSIESNQSSVAECMKKLQNPPAKYEEAYSELKELYDAYLELTNLATNPSGSLQTYSTNFNNADDRVAKCYKAMGIYVD